MPPGFAPRDYLQRRQSAFSCLGWQLQRTHACDQEDLDRSGGVRGPCPKRQITTLIRKVHQVQCTCLGVPSMDSSNSEKPGSRMHHDDVVAPQEDCEYTVTLGQSVLAVGSADSNEQRSGTVGHALFQYKFTPASVDTTIPGLVRVDESGGATVLRGTTARSVDGAITFKGKMIEQKDTECLLIFDGSSFRLERCDFALAQLRHIRSVPSQRRMPNGASSTEGKKNPKESTTARSRRPARPLASDNRKSLARLSSDSASQQDDSVTTVDASHQQFPSPLTTSPSTHVNDNGASPQAKRRRSEL